MDYLAGILEIIAKWWVGNKCKWGFILHLIAGALWTYVAIKENILGLIIVTIPATIINLRNFIKWNKKSNKM